VHFNGSIDCLRISDSLRFKQLGIGHNSLNTSSLNFPIMRKHSLMSEAQRATRYFRSWRVLKDDAFSSEDDDPAQRTTVPVTPVVRRGVGVARGTVPMFLKLTD
jgi:hypothetical protein